MKKVTLIADLDLKEEVFEKLRDLGTVQVVAETVTTRQVTDSLASVDLSSRLSKLVSLKAYFEKYNPIKKSFLDMFTGKKPEIAMADFEKTVASYDVDRMTEIIRDHEDRLKQIDAELSAIRSEMEMLTPWSPLDVPLESIGAWRRAESLLAVVPSASLEALDAAVSALPVVYEKVWQEHSEAGL